MGTKQQVIEDLFKHCRMGGNWEFSNELVKRYSEKNEFGNPFDVTKIDNSSVLPQLLRDEDYFIVHLGEGRHRFVKGIRLGYHCFEKIEQNETYDWKYRQSLLNELDTSESNILSVASNQRIIHDFLYEDIVANPKVYNARRTKASLKYRIGNETLSATNVQIEIDLTLEYHGVVTVVEGKNGFPEDFAVYQIFHPFKYYTMLKHENRLGMRQITTCYVLRRQGQGRSTLRLYNYTFEDENELESARLLKKAQYNLIKR